jgi:hypothetical protein
MGMFSRLLGKRTDPLRRARIEWIQARRAAGLPWCGEDCDDAEDAVFRSARAGFDLGEAETVYDNPDVHGRWRSAVADAYREDAGRLA